MPPLTTRFYQSRAAKLTSIGVTALVAISWLWRLAPETLNSLQSQRDLRTYYESAKVFVQGGDPYDYQHLVRTSGDTLVWRYVYPPLTLPLFTPLLIVPFETVRILYFIGQILGLIALLALWRRYLDRDSYGLPLLLLFIVFGYNAATGVDLDAGNIVILTQCLLWGAFACFLDRRYFVFVLLIVFASLFKGVDAVFLVLLICDRDPRAKRALVIGCVSVVALQVISFVFSPVMTREWLFNVYHLGERGSQNPAVLPLIDDLLVGVAGAFGYTIWWHASHIVYLCYAIAGFGTLLLFLKRNDPALERAQAIMLVVFAYTLLVPRFKNYSYILLIGPAAWMICTRIRKWWLKVTMTLLVVLPLFAYQPLITAAIFEVLLIVSMDWKTPLLVSHTPVVSDSVQPANPWRMESNLRQQAA